MPSAGAFVLKRTQALTMIFTERRRIEPSRGRDAEQPQRRLEFAAQDVQHFGRASAAARGEPVKRSPTEQYRLRAERERLRDVTATAYAAVDQ